MPKKTAPYIFLFIVLLYLFTFTNNIPCEVKFCPTYSEAQTKLVCQQVVQKFTTEPKHPNITVTMAKHKSNACLCLYPSDRSVQQPDSQVNNCSMCPLWTWTTAFNCSCHWSTIRIRLQVRILASEDMKLHCRSVLVIHRKELQDIPVNFSISLRLLLDPGLSSWLHTYQFSYTLGILFHSDSPRPSVSGLPRVRCANLTEKISNRTVCSLLVRELYKYVLLPIPFLDEVL